MEEETAHASDLDDKLIEEVRSHPILYDLKNRHYKSVNKRSQAWSEIAKKVNLSKEECQNRWKNLRSCYQKYKRMEQLASGSAAGNPKRKRRFSDSAMWFLDIPGNNRNGDGTSSETSDSDEVPVKRFRRVQQSGITNEKLCKLIVVLTKLLEKTLIKKDSTAELFGVMAAKIKKANLPASVVTALESKVYSTVFYTLINWYGNEQNEE